MGVIIFAIIIGVSVYSILLAFQKKHKKHKEEDKKERIKRMTEEISQKRSDSLNPILPKVYQKPDIIIPDWKDGAERYNCYTVKLCITNAETLVAHVLAKDFMLEPKEIDGEFHIFSKGIDVGTLLDRTNMLRDWISRGDPYFFCIQNLNQDHPEEDTTGCLAFYRDKRKGQEWREQTVTPLTAYRSDQKQRLIWDIKEGAHLILKKDYDYDDSVVVIWQESVIGKLTKSKAKRFLEEGAYSAFFERKERDKDYKDKPYIRIYWKNRKGE